MGQLNQVRVDASVRVGQVDLPIRRLLELSRGVTIALDQRVDAAVALHVGDAAIALGRIRVEGDRVRFEVTSLASEAEREG